MGVKNAIIFLLHCAYAHLHRPGSTVTVMFFDFSSEFNPIQPAMSFHLQKFSDNSANVGCITDGKDTEPSAT